MADTCPLLTLQPIIDEGGPAKGGILDAVIKGFPAGYRGGAEAQSPAGVSPRTLQYNFTQIVEWSQLLCSYIDGLSGGGADGGSP